MYYVSSHLLTGPKGSRLRVAGGDLANMVEYMQPVKVEENNFWHMRQVLKTQRKKVVQTPTLLPGTVFADISTGSLAPRSGGIVLKWEETWTAHLALYSDTWSNIIFWWTPEARAVWVETVLFFTVLSLIPTPWREDLEGVDSPREVEKKKDHWHRHCS